MIVFIHYSLHSRENIKKVKPSTGKSLHGFNSYFKRRHANPKKIAKIGLIGDAPCKLQGYKLCRINYLIHTSSLLYATQHPPGRGLAPTTQP